MAQLLPLNVGPKPAPVSPLRVPLTESTSLKTVSAELKKATSLALRPGNGPPAEADPPRGPGSVWAKHDKPVSRMPASNFAQPDPIKLVNFIDTPSFCYCACAQG